MVTSNDIVIVLKQIFDILRRHSRQSVFGDDIAKNIFIRPTYTPTPY